MLRPLQGRRAGRRLPSVQRIPRQHPRDARRVPGQARLRRGLPDERLDRVANAEVLDGITWANGIYDCSYFEVYRCDLDDQANWPALRALATQLRTAPHQANNASATLLVNGRTIFAPPAQGGTAQLEVLGAPGALAAVVFGAALEPAGIATRFGLLDLDPAPGLITAIVGALSPVGELTHVVPIPALALSGFGFQAVAVNAQGLVVLSGRTKVEIR